MWTSSLQSYPLDKQDSLISTLLVPRGFDTLEYSKVKATLVSVRLQIYSVRLRTANKEPPSVSNMRMGLGEVRLRESSTRAPIEQSNKDQPSSSTRVEPLSSQIPQD